MRPVRTNEVTLPLSPLFALALPTPTQDEKEKMTREQEILLRESGTIARKFTEENASEIAFVTDYFHHHPSETQLHAHYKGMQIVYHDAENKPITLRHAYFYWENTLYAKVMRQHLVGLGKFYRVKYLLDVTNQKWIVMRTPHNHESNFFHQTPRLTSRSIMQTEKKSNPLKENGKVKPVVLEQFCGLDLFYIYNIMTQSTHDYSALLKLPFLMVLAIEQFHQKEMIHGDIKPENLTLKFTNGKPHITPIDDELAIKKDKNGEYTAKILCFTKNYLAPELERYCGLYQQQCETHFIAEALSIKKVGDGKKDVFLYTPQSDIFALGESIRRMVGALYQKFPDQKHYVTHVKAICRLMKFAHPHARPSLSILKYVFFFLYWYHVLKRASHFSDALSADNIPSIALEKIQLITSIYIHADSSMKITSSTDWQRMRDINQAVESNQTTLSELEKIKSQFGETHSQTNPDTAAISMQP